MLAALGTWLAANGEVTITDLREAPVAVRLVASGTAVAWTMTDAGLRVTLPVLSPDGLGHAPAIQLPQP